MKHALIYALAIVLTATRLVAAFEPSETNQSIPATAKGSDAIPIKRKPPIYPRSALMSWVEGYVLVNFVVNVDSTVSDIMVLESTPQGTSKRLQLGQQGNGLTSQPRSMANRSGNQRPK